MVVIKEKLNVLIHLLKPQLGFTLVTSGFTTYLNVFVAEIVDSSIKTFTSTSEVSSTPSDLQTTDVPSLEMLWRKNSRKILKTQWLKTMY